MPIRRKLKSPEAYARELEQYRDVTKTVYDIYHASDIERQMLIQDYKRKEDVKKQAQLSPLLRLPQEGILDQGADTAMRISPENNVVDIIRDLLSEPTFNLDIISAFKSDDKDEFIRAAIQIKSENPRGTGDTTLDKNIGEVLDKYYSGIGQESVEERKEEIADEVDASAAQDDGYAARVEEIKKKYSGDPDAMFREARDLFKEKFPGVHYATKEYISLEELLNFVTKTGKKNAAKLAKNLTDRKNIVESNKLKKKEDKLNVRNINVQLPEVSVTPLKQTAKKGKSKSEPRKKKVAVQEGEGKAKSQSKSTKAKSKVKPAKRKSKVKPMRKSDMIYNILSQRAGNNNKLMAKRIAQSQ